MPEGPGKYDDVCTLARDLTNAEGVLLCVLGGSQGNGFSAQIQSPRQDEVLRAFAAALRAIADEMDADRKG